MKCQLCRKERKLRQSHILSKFLYKPLKRIEGRFYQLTDDPDANIRTAQDGVKAYMLCAACEAKRNQWETYFSNKWHRGELFGESDPYKLSNLDYKKTRLFLLSTLYMAHLSDDPLIAEVQLSTDSAESLRRLILEEDAGESSDFACIIQMLEEDGIDTKTLIAKAVTIEVGDARIHRFLFGGFQIAIIEPGEKGLAEDVLDHVLKEDGTIKIEKKRVRDLEYLMSTFETLRDQGKLFDDEA